MESRWSSNKYIFGKIYQKQLAIVTISQKLTNQKHKICKRDLAILRSWDLLAEEKMDRTKIVSHWAVETFLETES